MPGWLVEKRQKQMPNHWEVRCTTLVDGIACGHRKGSHNLTYGPGFTGLKSISHCAVFTGGEHTLPVCKCPGFSDGRYWQNSERIKN